MCGLINLRRLDGKDARKGTLHRYETQKGRGSEGYGFIALRDGVMAAYERAETEKDIKDLLGLVPCDEVIFHHRFPTSTPNFKEAAHPIKVSNPKLKHDYYVIHNGIISDDDEWKPKHEAEGFKYTTEMIMGYLVGGKMRGETLAWNDSEALAIELALDLEANGGGVQVSGSIAFIAIAVDKVTGKAVKKHWGRNDRSPLKYYRLKDIFETLASEGMGEDIKVNTLFTYDYETKITSEKPYQVGIEVKRIGYAATTYGSYHGRDYDYGYDYRGIGSAPAKTSALTESGFLDMPDEYYKCIEDEAALQVEIAFKKSANEDTILLEVDLSLVEDRIAELEQEHDEAELEYRLS